MRQWFLPLKNGNFDVRIQNPFYALFRLIFGGICFDFDSGIGVSCLANTRTIMGGNDCRRGVDSGGAGGLRDASRDGVHNRRLRGVNDLDLVDEMGYCVLTSLIADTVVNCHFMF